MTKSQFCWLLIRVAGLGCIVASVRGVVGAAILTFFLWSRLFQEVDRSVFNSLWPAFWGIVLLCLGLYLLFRGAGVHRLLMREE